MTETSKNVVVRFIDRIGALFLKAVPVLKGVEAIAVVVEPVLALTPMGPEYQVAVNAIVGRSRWRRRRLPRVRT